jgi:hypothetical protein
MDTFVEGDLSIDVATRAGAIVLSWRGKSNARDPENRLRAFFEGVANEATRMHAPVEMRLHALEYFNSSTLAAIIRMIRRLREQNTKTRILYEESSWQRRSFEALRSLAREGAVEIRGE